MVRGERLLQRQERARGADGGGGRCAEQRSLARALGMTLRVVRDTRGVGSAISLL